MTTHRTTFLRILTLTLTSLALVVGPRPAQAAFPGSDGALVYADDGIVRATVSADGQTLIDRRLTSGTERNPRWLAGGGRLVFNDRAGTISTMGAFGGDRQVVVGGRGYQPDPSPHLAGGVVRIAYVRVPTGGVGDIWTVQASGADPVRLTRSPPGTCGNSWPAWSPDGRYLAWQHRVRTPEGTCGGVTVVVLDRTSNRRTVLGAVHDPTTGFDLVPDKGRLSFTSDRAALLFPALAQQCVGLWGRYDLRSQEVLALPFYECEGAPRVRALVTTPSGDRVMVTTTAGRPTRSCVSWSGASFCRLDDDSRPPFPFDGVDVQRVTR